MFLINTFLLGAYHWGPFLEHIISGHEDPAAAVLPQDAEDGLSLSTSHLHFLEGRHGEHHCVGWEQQRITNTSRKILDGSLPGPLSWTSTTLHLQSSRQCGCPPFNPLPPGRSLAADWPVATTSCQEAGLFPRSCKSPNYL